MGRQKQGRQAKNARKSSASIDPQQTWEVEVIDKIRPRKRHKGGFEYHVKWWGYLEEEDTWEPIESLVDCERLLVSLWRAIGAVDFESKKIIDLPKEWVDAERRYFQQTFYSYKPPFQSHQPMIGISQQHGRQQVNIY